MLNVVFVVPYAMETTRRFVRAMANLPDVQMAVVSQQPQSELPEDIQGKIVAHERVRDPLDADQLEAAVRKIGRGWNGKIDRLCGILEQLQEPLAEVRERLRIRGMDVEESHNFRDKSVMKDVLRNAGLPCARFQLAASREEALAFAKTCMPLVVKPPDGAGARNTQRVESLEQLNSYLRTSPPSRAHPLLLEEFIIGREHSFDSISVGGQHLFHSISHYYPTPLEVMENAYLQWCVILPREIDGPEYDDIRQAGRSALDALGMVTGLTHMEWFRRADGSLVLSEVAARPPGAQFTTLISYAHDMDFYRAWAELTAFETFEAPERPYAAGAIFLRGQGHGRVIDVSGLEEAAEELGELVVDAKLPKTGQRQADTYEGEGYIILRHAETTAVEAGLKRLLQLIRVELG